MIRFRQLVEWGITMDLKMLGLIVGGLILLPPLMRDIGPAAHAQQLNLQLAPGPRFVQRPVAVATAPAGPNVLPGQRAFYGAPAIARSVQLVGQPQQYRPLTIVRCWLVRTPFGIVRDCR